MKRAVLLAWACAGVALAFACAKSGTGDDDAGVDQDGSSSVDAGACPQFDLKSDPKHCGSCTNACPTDQVCSQGACKATCDLPTTKCVADGGLSCADLTSDPQHCGSCATRCSVGDGGGLTPGNGNDASVFPDGGYDGGPGWVLGTPGCAMSKCTTNCPMGFTACEDNVCYDTKNFHDRCGDCSTQCAPSEWCTSGKCCAVDQLNCSGTCTSVLSDANNCGACNNKCPMNAPNCVGGVCTARFAFSASQTIDGQTVTCSSTVTNMTYTECDDLKQNGLYFPNGITCGPQWSAQNSAYSDTSGFCKSLTNNASIMVYYTCSSTTTRATWKNHVWGTFQDNGYTQHVRCYY